jgi:hypothetical protein
MFNHVAFEVRFLLGSVRAVRAGELWLLPALVALMARKVPLVLVGLATVRTHTETCQITL